jgi:competence protein ComEC
MPDATCFVLDVGQGMSSVIVMPGGRALVVDCGRSPRVAIEQLELLPAPVSIEALVVSHNDVDHSGGAPAIVAAYFDRLQRIYFLEDRPLEQITWLDKLERDFRHVRERLTRKYRRLETWEREQFIWPEPSSTRSVSADEPQLSLLFPTLGDNLDAKRESDTNATSAVLKFRCGPGSVLFPGDAPKGAWQHLKGRFGRLECDVLVFPHHGGKLGESSATEADVQWLLKEAIACKQLVVFSVGTKNDYEHPDRDVVRVVAKLAGAVACTEITGRCHARPLDLAPSLLGGKGHRDRVSRSGMTPDGSEGVGCMGTVEVRFDDRGAHVGDLDEHQRLVDEMRRASPNPPLCRGAVRAKPTRKKRSRK